MKSIFIFIPDSLDKTKYGFLRGFHHDFDNCEAYYITSCQVYNKSSYNCIGYLGSSDKNKLFKDKNLHLIHYDPKSDKVVFNRRYSDAYTSLKIIYNYEAFKNTKECDGESSWGEHFAVLSEYLQNKEGSIRKTGYRTLKNLVITPIVFLFNLLLMIFGKCGPVTKVSLTLTHLEDSIKTALNLLETINNTGKISPQIGNIIIARFIDLVAGIILLQYLLQYETLITDLIGDSTEFIIANLKELLLYLMGSPIGLKLNYAFNMTLGIFFFYHISLWRVFLDGIQLIFRQHFGILVLPLTFGLSFQIAMLSDIISITTFHMYCIYVYAARLFNLQLRGITSLWRLFIGRKYNPLRERVDSCEYSPHQLFIGTLGFTVLLFLMPTTMLYYTVFTSLRVLLKVLDAILMKLIYLLKYLPVYIIWLWIINSYSISGTLYLEWKETKEKEVYLKANIHSPSLVVSICKFIPKTYSTKSTNWTKIFHSLLTGILL